MAEEFTGKSGNARVGDGTANATIDVTGWSVTPAAEDHRVDNSGSGDYSDSIAEIQNCEFTIDANHNKAKNIYDTAPVIKAGTILIDVRLFFAGNTSDTTKAHFHFPKALVLSVPTTSESRGVTRFTINGRNKGQFNYPDGAALVA